MKIISHKIPPGGAYSSGHMSRINSVCFHKEESMSNLLISGGLDQRVILYDLRAKKFVGTIVGPYIMGDSLDIRGNIIMTGSYNSKYKIQFWDLRKGMKYLSAINEVELDANIFSAQFNKNLSKLQLGYASSSANGVKVFEFNEDYLFKKNELYMSTRFLEKPCYTLDFSNQGDYIAFSGADANIRIVNL
jgi:WD40 repeat protein